MVKILAYLPNGYRFKPPPTCSCLKYSMDFALFGKTDENKNEVKAEGSTSHCHIHNSYLSKAPTKLSYIGKDTIHIYIPSEMMKSFP